VFHGAWLVLVRVMRVDRSLVVRNKSDPRNYTNYHEQKPVITFNAVRGDSRVLRKASHVSANPYKSPVRYPESRSRRLSLGRNALAQLRQ